MEKAAEEPDLSNPENERKLMIQQLRKSTKKTLRFLKLPPPRQRNDYYVLQNRSDLIVKAIASEAKHNPDATSDQKIERVNIHHRIAKQEDCESSSHVSILKKKLTREEQSRNGIGDKKDAANSDRYHSKQDK